MERFSIVTVCYNAENEIESTLKSVLCQNFTDYQYIIKDGNSTDNTSYIIKKYLPEFEKKGINVQFISSPDAGIFDAMNIALTFVTGKYVNYLNAGDSYFCSTVLKDINNLCMGQEADVIYGHTMCSFYNESKFVFVQNVEKIFDGIYQQACFIRNEILQKFQFDTHFFLLADYDLLIKIYINKYNFVHANTIVGIYDRNGISKKEYGKFFQQMDEIKKKYNYPLRSRNISSGIVDFLKTIFNKKMPMLSDWLYAFHTINRSKDSFRF